MLHTLLPYVPFLVSLAAIVAAAACLRVGRSIGPRAARHAIPPALFLGVHGLVGIVLATGRVLGVPHQSVGVVAAMLDVASIFLLAWMLVDAFGVVAHLRTELQVSRVRAQEYERARAEYATILRHRIANPLTVVSGGVRTLQGLDDELDVDRRRAVLAAIGDAIAQLERVSLDPEPVSREEQGLSGRPDPSVTSTRAGSAAPVPASTAIA